MSVHVLLDSTFFATSVPVADQQRVLLVPPGKGLNVGDTIFLRNEAGDLTWVSDVLAVGEMQGCEAWLGKDEPPAARRHALIGYLAKIHPGTLPRGTSRLAARWVTLNKRTLPGTLPWWDDAVMVYHSTLRLIEGLMTPEEIQQALERGYLNAHPSGHWVIPHGEARKRILVHVRGLELVCGLCGGPIASLEEATQDHVIPVSQGGPDALANVQLAHRSCNELKGNALPEQYPPFFPQPGAEAAGWYGRVPRRARNGRGGVRRGRPAVTTGAFQAQPVDVPAPVAATLEAAAAGDGSRSAHKNGSGGKKDAKAAPAAKATDAREASRAKGTPEAAASAKTAADEQAAADKGAARAKPPGAAAKAGAQDPASGKAAAATPPADGAAGADEGAAGPAAGRQKAAAEEQPAPAAKPAEAVEADPAWLEAVQADTLTALQARAREAHWAARTATLRTIEQLPRALAAGATSKGRLLAEAEGRKGTFRLLDWEGRSVLVEERGRRRTVHLVHMIHALSPDAYVWYLSRFGRTSPLAVAMALLPLLQKGVPDQDGRLLVSKNGSRFVVTVDGDRIVSCSEEASLAAS